MTSVGVRAPDDLVLVGYISGAYGIHGWVRIRPYSSDADALMTAKTWWLENPPLRPELHDVDRLEVKIHGEDVVAKLVGVVDRNTAEGLKGSAVKIPRSHFPALSEGEFYWLDLIGLSVHNLQGEHLGQVRDLMDNGAHPILRVAASDIPEIDLPKHERLIPFVENFVKEVDQKAGKITVDWGTDY
ncbi:ribosome maturation factor RimM [Undibacterium sp. RTI2.1]|uniref:ribosome maturation factor RimM n=1 Tax=unclassified Undibacterium TaxID=2630295 RepID=UPI002AB46CB0|nr:MULTISPECIES: ribosome maturation factor RimM [unclassified Undibacterium]MDY7538583.1 ribosome maturation factor RimM [Undibacterium sp. 5I1]MEB0031272.1 ribosome maturation factor RimM [Undibacterium sp. RTI2.1]MEB0116336.1 ribosome maturation factor RimM [Undibacterium sp. RTI2.2]MEB0232185.1 ribosome maturation factor RimM [Undibacterium sp. 10I3]MEB0258085.1 ribosome maturation factor RimM [Undibacterium sp. 5I1]